MSRTRFDSHSTSDTENLPLEGPPVVVRMINPDTITWSIWIPKNRSFWIDRSDRRKAWTTRSAARKALVKAKAWFERELAQLNEAGQAGRMIPPGNIKGVRVVTTPIRFPLPTPLFTRTHESDNGYYDTDMAHYARQLFRSHIKAWLDGVHLQATKDRVEPIDRFDLMAMVLMNISETMLLWDPPQGGE
mgnify:CR=1 FL=1